ncbi:5-oxoprolinase (ATP-hydrolysing) [Rhizomicrobium palustre]|uniref:5-oxoprolinase (ATP-hydrolysing) n=1 Tax=Rhizomicrobium palustre TaxID=189966 RepID=A0A846MXS4_9PROT|nr:hydantoinase B/oxoprolinase family protein [Rhizomicrobium palustre]NIK88388.1 5-oxoprolinase (ATP-hydrolysing) [Rhizomicrobium palustre]
MQNTWQFWIDRGGTFTDVVGRGPDGHFTVVKMLSQCPERYSDAAVAGIATLMGLPESATPPREALHSVRMGTTVATNALLERKGARTLFVINRGFGDVLEIGPQARPKLFDLEIKKPAPLYEAVEEVQARIAADGSVLAALDEEAARAMFVRRRREGLDAVAIALIHAWAFPEMELRLAALARETGFSQVSLSHTVSPLLGLVARAATTVADAYLSPVLRRYVDKVSSALGGAPLAFMQSSGGLADAALFQGKDAILSGPAGGIVGAARTAEAAGIAKVIGFDMGGTSTDVSLYAGEFERVFDTQVAGVDLRVPMMAINTVAAGGGSILHFDGARLSVGPDSAGADPGPACYRRGGPLTITDANVMCGKIRPERFPTIFGPHGDQPLDAAVVAEKFAALAEEILAATGVRRDPRALAEDFLAIAVSNMAQAIKQISLEKGHDPAEFTLQCFGGAGGQHACLVADELGMSSVLIHPFAGVLSAFGMGMADEGLVARQAVDRLLDVGAIEAAKALLDTMAAELEQKLVGGQRIATTNLRYQGTETALPVAFADETAMRASFEDAHRRRFGFAAPERAIVLESVTCEIVKKGERPKLPNAAAGTGVPTALERVALWCGGESVMAPVYARAHLGAGDKIDGPALISEEIATTMVEPGWRAEMQRGGELVLTRMVPRRNTTVAAAEKADPMLLELFNNLFMAAAERMGVVLKNTATSVNIRERLDFSCAVFDASGNLIANAPHVPVHLGAMSESVRSILAKRGSDIRPGDMFTLNNPYNGGTHLPDITVIAPVFDESGMVLRFFVGNRGHHSDIGGATPGSTPPNAKRLEEEGVVIDDFLLCRDGVFREEAFRALLADAPYPARNADANVADIRAQIAANQAGIAEMKTLVARYGWEATQAYTGHVMANAEECVRRTIARLSDGAFHYVMDDGAPLCVSVCVDHAAREAVIDFSGTGPEREGNFNAPPAVTRAVVLFVFRSLVGDELPLNEGCLKPLKLIIPGGSFLAPRPGRAVVAGNTEVSQAVCNALFGALATMASSQATMNNFLIGNDAYQYYETICGGAGAGPGFHGASAVHTQMTNTRITDPEILETRYPLRLEQFGVRRGSGGDGAFQGGDGVLRGMRALTPAIATLVSSRRTRGPFGLNGGSDGAPGQQWITRVDGTREEIGGVAEIALNAGDTITIATPGGGGYGKK